MTFFLHTFRRSGSSRINMGVDRIILLIAIIGVVENEAALIANDGPTCGDFRGKYLFELTPAANEIDLLSDLVKSAKSAIVRKSGIEGDPVQVVISPEDFTEFERKSRALKVYRSHSSECADQTRNIAIVEANYSRFALPSTKLSGNTNKNSSVEVSTPPGPNTTKKLEDKMCSTPNFCEPKLETNLINASLSSDVKKSVKATAPSSTIFDDSSSPFRILRASKTKNGTSKQKSKVKATAKFRNGKIRGKPAYRRKSAKGNNRKKSGKKVTKARSGNKKTTLIRARGPSTQESWKKLMTIAAKSLTKPSDTYTKSKSRKKVKSPVATRKLLAPAKPVNAKKLANGKKKSSKPPKRQKTKNMGQPAAKMSTSAKKQTDSLKQRRPFPKSQGRRNPTGNPKTREKIGSKNRKSNRDRRELKISAETACTEDHSKKRSAGHLAKRDFSFRAPGGCTVIKISTPCDDDCLEYNGEYSGENASFIQKDMTVHSSRVPQLFIPVDVPAGSDYISFDYLNEFQPEESFVPPVSGKNKNTDLSGFEEDAAPPQSLSPVKLLTDYESQEEPPKLESVDLNYYPEGEQEPTDNPSTTNHLRYQNRDRYSWYKPSYYMPPYVDETLTQSPLNWFDDDDDDEDDESDNDDDDYDDDDDDEDENYEDYEEYEEEKKTQIPTVPISHPLLYKHEDNFLVHSSEKDNYDVIDDSKDEYKDEESDDKDEDYDIDDNYDDDDEDDYDTDDD